MRCVAYCMARNYDLNAINKFFKSNNLNVKLYRNVLHLKYEQRGEVFIFANGCFVAWGLTCSQEKHLAKQLKAFAIAPLSTIEIDYFAYKYAEETTITSHERYNVDIITLESDSLQLKLALSYGFAQSIKLESYEETIQNTIRKNSHLPEELAKSGRISLSRADISRRMGEIFLERSSINLNSEYIDIPEYFWKYPSFEAYYVMAEQFLNMQRRVAALNQKLDVLQEIFDMLTNELHHRHTSLLEWIIILLIFLELVFDLLRVVFHILG